MRLARPFHHFHWHRSTSGHRRSPDHQDQILSVIQKAQVHPFLASGSDPWRVTHITRNDASSQIFDLNATKAILVSEWLGRLTWITLYSIF